MTIDVRDGSEYFRGLLLLISKDRKIADPERVLMRRIGRALGFEKEFCENAVREILENRFIVDEPPRFSTRELGMTFIRDGLMLAGADDETHRFEEGWLKATAERNGIEEEWFRRELERASRKGRDYAARLEVEDLKPPTRTG